MRVCFVAGTLGRGGAEKQLVFMLEALKRLGVAAKVLCLTKGESYETEIRNLGVDIKWVGGSRHRLLRLRDIITSLRECDVDIVHSSHFYTNLYAALGGRYLGIRSVGAVRSDLVYEIGDHKFTGQWQIRLPDVLVANSDLACRRLIERGVDPSKIEFLGNVAEAGCRRPKTNSADQSIKVLFVGRLDKNKRPERFVRLAAALSKELPRTNVEFQIAGQGEQLRELENLAKQLNLSPRKLKFLGVCMEMKDVYRDADILVSTSDREGTPNAVLEAMAHGVPVVATRVGGTGEILGDNRGFLVEPGDEGALVKATAKLIGNQNLRVSFGAEGQKYVREKHSPKTLQVGLSRIYEKVLGRG